MYFQSIPAIVSIVKAMTFQGKDSYLFLSNMVSDCDLAYNPIRAIQNYDLFCFYQAACSYS